MKYWVTRIILLLILGAITIVVVYVSQRDTETDNQQDHQGKPHPLAQEQEPLVSPDGQTVIRLFTLQVGALGRDTFWLIGRNGDILLQAYSEDASNQLEAISWVDNDTIQIPFLADSGDFRTRLLDIAPD